MKNLKMNKKVVVAFGSVIICFLITIAFCLMGMNTISRKYDTFFHVRHEASLRARSMRVNLQSEVKSIVLAAVAGQNGADDATVKDLLAQQGGFQMWADAMEPALERLTANIPRPEK